jgi:tetratricopeptide (TPR) repeat protein
MKGSRAYCRILTLSVVFSLTAVTPQWIFAQTKKGIDLYESGNYREAEKVFREALKTDPSNATAKFHLGLSLLAQENYRDALDIFQKLNQGRDKEDKRPRPSVPNQYELQIALARAHLGLQQFADAWKNLESARIENPGSSDVYVYRGVYYLNQEKYQEAIGELEKAISLDKNNPYAFYYAGLAYFRSGNPQKAVDALKSFLKLAPYAPEASEAKRIVDILC